MGSQTPDSASSHHRHTCSTFEMEAMKVEKDNACDQADVSEEKMKAARVRAQKGEDEVEELMPPTMRFPRSSPPASLTWRRPRSALMWVRPRFLSWRRSSGWWRTT